MILRFSKYLATENSFDVLDFWSKLRANYANRGMCKSAVCDLDPKSFVVFSTWMSGRSLENSRQRALCRSGCIVKVHWVRSRTHWMHYCQLRLKDLHREHKSFVRERFPWCFWYPRQIYQFRMMAFGNQERGPHLSPLVADHITRCINH